MDMVLSFGGASRDAVFMALRRAVVGARFGILVLDRDEEKEFSYREFDGTLDEALASVEHGVNSSVQLAGQAGSALLAGVYRPRFAQDNLTDWFASVEGRGLDLRVIFDELLRIDGLGYVALSKEESPDFETEHVTEATFPWSDWKLVGGATRKSNGEWIVRHYTR